MPTVMGERYDALASLDTTRAVTPLGDQPAGPGEEQQTYPWSV